MLFQIPNFIYKELQLGDHTPSHLTPKSLIPTSVLFRTMFRYIEVRQIYSLLGCLWLFRERSQKNCNVSSLENFHVKIDLNIILVEICEHECCSHLIIQENRILLIRMIHFTRHTSKKVDLQMKLYL